MAAIRSSEASQEVIVSGVRPTRRPLHRRLPMATTIVATLAMTMIAAGTAEAIPSDIVYGNFSGDTVDYINVTEDSQGLYGTPIITGDTLTFSPVSFEAFSQDGGITHVDGTLSFILDAKSGFTIDEFQIAETGAFSLLGAGTDVTMVQVKVAVGINILEINDAPVVPGTVNPFVVDIVLASFDLDNDGPVFLAPWSGVAQFDLVALANQHAGVIGGGITKVGITINNGMLAISEDGTLAYIDKKAINGVTITTPEPDTLALAMLGGTMVLYGRFRRRRAA